MNQTSLFHSVCATLLLAACCCVEGRCSVSDFQKVATGVNQAVLDSLSSACRECAGEDWAKFGQCAPQGCKDNQCTGKECSGSEMKGMMTAMMANDTNAIYKLSDSCFGCMMGGGDGKNYDTASCMGCPKQKCTGSECTSDADIDLMVGCGENTSCVLKFSDQCYGCLAGAGGEKHYLPSTCFPAPARDQCTKKEGSFLFPWFASNPFPETKPDELSNKCWMCGSNAAKPAFEVCMETMGCSKADDDEVCCAGKPTCMKCVKAAGVKVIADCAGIEEVKVAVSPKVLDATEKSAAETKITAAMKSSEVEKVRVSSAVKFAVKLNDIKEGSQARKDFEIGFKKAMAARLNNMAIVITSVEGSARRRLLETTLSRRRLQDAVKVNFYAEAPKSMANEAASLVTTLQQSKDPMEVEVGGKKIGADLSSLAAPEVYATQSEPDVRAAKTAGSMRALVSFGGLSAILAPTLTNLF